MLTNTKKQLHFATNIRINDYDVVRQNNEAKKITNKSKLVILHTDGPIPSQGDIFIVLKCEL